MNISNEAPFEASMLVYFRKRLNRDLVGRINKKIVVNRREQQTGKQPETKEKTPKKANRYPSKTKEN